MRDALFRGQKIEAIKIFRGATGCDLKAAKDAVDAVEKKLRQAAPESFRQDDRRGCLGVALACLGFAGCALYAWLR